MNPIHAINALPDGTKHALDAAAAITVVGALADYLPPIAALFTVAWCSMQMFAFVEARIKARKPVDKS